jgi:hypothetical protein
MVPQAGAGSLWPMTPSHTMRSFVDIRVIRKVRKTQHQNPEFGHTQGEIEKKVAKKYISIQWGVKLRKPSILVVN